MKLGYRWSFLFVAVLLFFGSSYGLYVQDQVIVQYKSSGLISFSMDASLDANLAIVSLDGESVEDAVARISQDPDVLYVQPNYVYYTQSFGYPNDTHFGSQWGLHNTGQGLYDGQNNLIGVGTSGADISWLNAMQVWSGVDNPSVTGTIVAVIDNGVLYTHEDLSDRMWDGTNCVTKDGNPLGNCIHGYDYYTNDLNPSPNGSDYHGTHVAGIIGASLNMIGVSGVNPNSRIMALRAGNGSTLTTQGVINSINFAQQNGAKIINASFGGSGNDVALGNAIAAYSGLFIAAAGNQAWNHDVISVYPCDYAISHVICVGASTYNETYASFSDYSTNHVDVVAPGQSIASTINSSGSSAYGYLNGTSMATPFVAGLASLIWTYRPQLDRLQVRDIIFNTVDVFPEYATKVGTSGRINALAAIQYAGTLVAGTVDPFSFDAITGAVPLTMYESNIVTISGISTSVGIVVDFGGEYRINGGEWVSITGSISSGDTLQVRTISSWEPSLTDGVYLSVGDYGVSFLVTTMDSVLDTNQSVELSNGNHYKTTTGLSLNLEALSGTDYRIFGEKLVSEYTGTLASGQNTIPLVLNAATGISYIGVVFDDGMSQRYYSDYVVYDTTAPVLQSFSLTSGTILYGTSVSVSGIFSDDFALGDITGLAVGCDYATVDVTSCAFSGTLAVESGNFTILLYLHDKAGNLNIVSVPVFVDLSDRTPDVFSFTAQTNIARSTVVESNTITLAGVDTGVSISIVGGQYKINTGSFVSTTGTVFSGDIVQLKLTSSSSYSTLSTATVTVGTRTGAWNVTTQAAPVAPSGGPSGGPTGGSSCNPSSVTHGSVNSSSCQITCTAGYSLSGQQCLLTTGTGTKTGDIQLQHLVADTTEVEKTINGEKVSFLVPTFSQPKFTNLSTVLTTWITQQARQKGVRGSKIEGVVDDFNVMMQSLHAYPELGDKSVAVSLVTSFTSIVRTLKNTSSVAGVSSSRTLSSAPIPTDNPTELDDAIAFLYAKGLTSFSTRVSFRPNDTITREQAAKFGSQFVENVRGIQPEMNTLCTFSDADQITSTLIPYVRKLCWHGIISGGKFRPADLVTRAEAVTFVMRALGVSVPTTDPWYNAYFSVAASQGIITSSSTANANNTITRGNMAIMLYRASKK